MTFETDFSDARHRMVESQIRPVRVNDPRILEAMRILPRELFVPPHRRSTAYADTLIELDGGRALFEPRVLARLLQIAQPRAGERACVVAAGTCYGAAVLARLGLAVTALEEDPSLVAIARAAIAHAHPAGAAIDIRQVPLAAGLSSEPAFDLVVVEGGVELIPQAVEALVSPQGRLVTVQIERGAHLGQGVVAEHAGGGLRARPHFDAAARVLPGFARPARFQL